MQSCKKFGASDPEELNYRPFRCTKTATTEGSSILLEQIAIFME